MMNILAAVHSAQYFLSAVNMSKLNPTDHKSITASHFPDENFREAVRELVESISNVEAEFSRDYGF